MNVSTIIAFSSTLFSGVLAFAIGWRGRTTVYRSFAAGMLVLAAESGFNGLAIGGASPEEKLFWEQCALIAASFLPGIWLFFSLSYGRGNYRDFLHRWRGILALSFLLPIGLAVLFNGRLISLPGQIHGRWLFPLGIAGITLNVLFLAGSILALMNLERTFRAAIGTVRWRIKFMVIGLGILFTVRSYTATQALLFHNVDLSLQGLNAIALLAGCALMVRTLFRSGHFEVDIYPSHSILQNSFTALLAGVYLIVIGVFASIVASLGGDNSFAAKAFFILVAFVLLAVLLLSDRVQMQTSRFISRHFQRPQYDYRHLWRSFREATASCVNEDELCRATIKLTANIFRALAVTILLMDEKDEKLNFAASTSASGPKTSELNLAKDDFQSLVEGLRQHGSPFDIDLSREKWATALKAIHLSEFATGGRRVCAPLIVNNQLLGLIILGDRIGGINFTGQDLDLLKCVADEVAASLLNICLSKKLLQAREFEAFQTMSAFFVHDLKNAAASLNLMLQNLPMHFGKPEFREDSLRAVGKSVAHINRLIERLTQLRHELKINPQEEDLNEWIGKSLFDLEKNSGVTVVKEFKPLPKISFDKEQMSKVVTNLALNAKEAMQGEGEIHIATNRVNGWAVFSVSDNGSGMDPEFINQFLFRPFQTTKKSGLGIGMFQSKMIIEAHRGKIEVQSETGKGTTFRVYLPVEKI